ncbi:MAG: class II aldolase/adducin family protein [Spirochaetaceae bacterium]|jgi:L-fuculose-phosphate aldolase|nr:class II aldolase/adducin family protein [Spirochaetaceae bacterium]
MYKKLIVDSGRRMLNSGLTVETWGNISARDKNTGLVYLTPSAMSYDIICEDDIIVAKTDGSIVEGRRKPTVEFELHLGVYNARPEINAVVHTHPVYSQIFGALRESIPAVIDEAAQILGAETRCARYELPGTKELAAACVEALGKNAYACLLANHGAVSIGADMNAAFRVAKVLEMTAQIYAQARMIGNVHILDKKSVDYMHNFAYNQYGQK